MVDIKFLPIVLDVSDQCVIYSLLAYATQIPFGFFIVFHKERDHFD